MPLKLIRADITKVACDAIVNAANSSLLGGGGVDGAIHRAAGPELLAECRALGGCRTGEAKLTKGYLLPCRYVIHTVGPVWYGGGRGEEKDLRSYYRNCLALAKENGCESVAFPLISAGAYGYPKDQAMDVAVSAITHFLLDHEMTVYLVVFGRTEFMTGKKLFRDIQEYIDDVYAKTHVRENTERYRERKWRDDESEALDMDTELAPCTPEEECEAPKRGPSFFRGRKAVPPVSADKAFSYSSERAVGSNKEGLAFITDRSGWEDLLRRTDESFSQALMRMIDERHMTDTQCYKLANVDRKLFSKIRSNPDYRPSKPTVFAFAIALKLTLNETRELLSKAGFALSHSSKFDIILEYCIGTRHFDINEINQILFEFDLPLLGNSRSE
jgi:O-acetyl-ADP-ribose deacetylase (regulator of RNase III)